MMFQQDPFGSLPQFGGQQWQPPMAGGGFAGMEGLDGLMGGGMFGAPGGKKKKGFPWEMMAGMAGGGLMGGLLGGGMGNMAGMMMSPLGFGLAKLFK
jgi:hypothetical protein